jgi:hypothetical protein
VIRENGQRSRNKRDSSNRRFWEIRFLNFFTSLHLIKVKLIDLLFLREHLSDDDQIDHLERAEGMREFLAILRCLWPLDERKRRYVINRTSGLNIYTYAIIPNPLHISLRQTIRSARAIVIGAYPAQPYAIGISSIRVWASICLARVLLRNRRIQCIQDRSRLGCSLSPRRSFGAPRRSFWDALIKSAIDPGTKNIVFRGWPRSAVCLREMNNRLFAPDLHGSQCKL